MRRRAKRGRRRVAVVHPDISMLFDEFEGHYTDQIGGGYDAEGAVAVLSEFMAKLPTDLGWWLELLNNIASDDPPDATQILSAILPTFKDHLGGILLNSLHDYLEDEYVQDTHEDYPGQHYYPKPGD